MTILKLDCKQRVVSMLGGLRLGDFSAAANAVSVLGDRDWQ
jgi:hypothetical protein